MEKPYLQYIKKPSDISKLNQEQLSELCEEIREKLITVVSKNGGHLASNLGTVELTVALEKVFCSENDSIVWDVGHQCYTHKLLTGRADKFSTIRTEGGLSGFPKREESIYDAFNAGHSSTSISAGYGIARAKSILGKDGYTVAVIGDGALTGGMAYEGLNNAGRFNKNFIVVLNDNKMSISKNVGSIAKYLKRVRVKPRYLKAKDRAKSSMIKIPAIGKPLFRFTRKVKQKIRHSLYQTVLFEDMGFHYYGPIDGHNIAEMTEVFENVKEIKGPVLVHIVTKKGKGYAIAENKPKEFHGVSPFDIETGEPLSGKTDYSYIFGDKLVELAKKDQRICAITSAMTSGTGLSRFSTEFKSRFFDTGIAEEHAVTFAGGLASQGALPFFAVYSTFLQRGVDQIIHDIAMQKLHIVLCIDRAGIVGDDGETHQGVFDVSLLNPIPNLSIYSPTYFRELEMCLETASYKEMGTVAVRYPRGTEPYRPDDFICTDDPFVFYGDENADILIVTYGKIFSNSCVAREKLVKDNISICILKLNKIKPISKKALYSSLQYKEIFFFEEGMAIGGIGEHFFNEISSMGFTGKFKLTAIDDVYVKHAKVESIWRKLKLDSDGMTEVILENSEVK